MTNEADNWEYRVIDRPDESALNQLGESGWELVGVDDGKGFLKRPVPSFKERVTTDQKRRYYATWGRDIPEDRPS
jgi:hypothetical protein